MRHCVAISCENLVGLLKVQLLICLFGKALPIGFVFGKQTGDIWGCGNPERGCSMLSELSLLPCDIHTLKLHGRVVVLF